MNMNACLVPGMPAHQRAGSWARERATSGNSCAIAGRHRPAADAHPRRDGPPWFCRLRATMGAARVPAAGRLSALQIGKKDRRFGWIAAA